MRITIVDDKPLYLDNIRKAIKRFDRRITVACVNPIKCDAGYGKGDQTLANTVSAIQKTKPDMIFLDDELTVCLGIQIVMTLKMPKKQLIGTSGGGRQSYCCKNFPETVDKRVSSTITKDILGELLW